MNVEVYSCHGLRNTIEPATVFHKTAPNIMMTVGGAQLKKVVTDDGIYWWKFHVDWKDPAKSKLQGPVKIDVAPYEYLGGGQLTRTVPQPETTQRLDVQGDKLMARLVYRRIGHREIIVGAQSVKTVSGGGGIRWYEFRLDKDRYAARFGNQLNSPTL